MVHNIAYICFAGYSHLDWGGTLETLKELKRRGHDVTILSGPKIEDYVNKHKLMFYDIGLDNFRPRQENETIEDTLAYHQFHNFFNIKSVVESYEKGLEFIKNNDVDLILSDPLCKAGPLLSMKMGIPYAVMGPYNYQPEGKVDEDNTRALNEFLEKFEAETKKLGIKEGHKLPLVQNSPWLNIVYSVPEFDGDLQEPNITHVGSDILPPSDVQKNKDKLQVFYSSGTIFWDYKQVEAVTKLAEKYPIDLFMTKGRIIPDINGNKNIKIYDFCDDKQIIPNMDLLITQGGLGTVTNGIRGAVPMIVMPLFWYNIPQSIKVERYGNGLSLNSLDKQITLLDKTFEEITSNNKYQERAYKLQKKFESFGGSVRAADLICDLVD